MIYEILILLVLLVLIIVILFKNITKNKIKIAIFALFKNNRNYLNYFVKKMKKLEKIYDIEYFIYENNSYDGTKKILKKFMKNRKGKLVSENLINMKISKGINKSRGEKMALLRNRNKINADKTNANYIFILDSEVYFKNNIFKKMINLIDFNPSYGLITPFDICYKNYFEVGLPHYYDSLALILNNDISYKENNNTCMFKGCRKCKIKRELNNINYLESELLERDKLIEVKSAFGGLALIKKNDFKKVSWGSTICEHHSFCEQIRNLNKKIIIDPTISVVTSDNDFKKVNLEKINKYLKKHNN